eukprot:12417531-Karenia_brevis.AAC.1
MGLTISILLYADDAALPADSEKDLQMSARIFEQYCNEHRLFVSVPKSFITVFHSVEDTSVAYSDTDVTVDGKTVDVEIYGRR